MYAEEEQSRSYWVTVTYSINSSLEGQSSFYFDPNFYSSKPQAIVQQGQRTQGWVNAMTSAAGLLGIEG